MLRPDTVHGLGLIVIGCIALLCALAAAPGLTVFLLVSGYLTVAASRAIRAALKRNVGE